MVKDAFKYRDTENLKYVLLKEDKHTLNSFIIHMCMMDCDVFVLSKPVWSMNASEGSSGVSRPSTHKHISTVCHAFFVRFI